jgi:hypothetical protein
METASQPERDGEEQASDNNATVMHGKSPSLSSKNNLIAY